MSSNDSQGNESGAEASSAQDSRATTPEGQLADGMKRAAAKQLIEAYYFQLTDGCGNADCANESCASSKRFSMRDKDKNALAILSIDMFKKKAQLCEKHRRKIARLPENSDDAQSTDGRVSSDSLFSAGPSTSQPTGATVAAVTGASILAPFAEPSTSRATPGKPASLGAIVVSPGSLRPILGATPKSLLTTPEKKDNFLDEEKLQSILEFCHDNGEWSRLIKTIGSVYSDPEALLQSFRKKNKNAFLKEKLLSVEVDSDKDIDEKEDSESGEIIHSKPVVADTKGGIDVDMESLTQCYTVLKDIPDQPYLGALIIALLSLSRGIDMDLRYTKLLQRESHFLNIFVIVFEIPFLHSPEFIESAFPEICRTVGLLSIPDQVKLVKYWSEFGAEKLRDRVLSVQQLITVKLIDGESKWGRNYSLNDEDHITGPIKYMKLLYYASMYGGEKDAQSLLDEEKELLESDNHLQQELLGASAMGHDAKEPRQTKDDPLAKELELSHIDCRKPLVSYEDFVNETLNEYINVEIDYKYKLESEENANKFSFANHSFILTTASKQMSLYMDNRIQMYKERRSSILQTIMHGMPPMPFLRIRVSRDRIIDDALVALEMVAMENPSDLRKQLFVEFDGEQGLDEGGVSKEFFQLIVEEIFNVDFDCCRSDCDLRKQLFVEFDGEQGLDEGWVSEKFFQLVVEEIFNVDFGMFTYSTETNQFWFNSMSFENDGQFTLIGIVLGLAIYNSTIVDVHFPPVVYRKLVGKKGQFEDLKDVDPTLAKSLQEMLDYKEEDFEDVFMQTFQISYRDVFGSTITHELREKGDSIPVTQENKQLFVDMYADFILNKSIEKQFGAFRRGFQMVTNESPLKTLFRPNEIELLICGSENLDFHDLEKATEYDGGFDKNSTTIVHFWEVVHAFDEEQKRKLIQFTTGTDRVPVGGLSKLKLIIARNGPDSDRLPTAHTCFNVLLLPDYQNRDNLRERLLKAITYSKGFGML